MLIDSVCFSPLARSTVSSMVQCNHLFAQFRTGAASSHKGFPAAEVYCSATTSSTRVPLVSRNFLGL